MHWYFAEQLQRERGRELREVAESRRGRSAAASARANAGEIVIRRSAPGDGAAMSPGYTTAALDTLPATDGPGDGQWKPLRHLFGITAFGVNAWVAEGAGDEIIAEHSEKENDVDGHEELYLVTRGSATFTVGG